MLEVDGSLKSGSGTILRYSLAIAGLLGKELHLKNIRAKRSKPGLRPQHLKAVEACKLICKGKVEGAEVGSKEITFKPGKTIKGGYYELDIGTAGSTTMLAMSLLPLLAFAENETTLRIKGGIFQDNAPSAFHMKYVLFHLLEKMGLKADLKLIRPGYVPKGNGILEVKVEPTERLKPLKLPEQGNVVSIEGIALSSRLEHRKVSDRMAKACEETLKAKGYHAKIERLYDRTALQEGAALAVWAKTSTGCLLGSDMAGKPGRSSEYIGKEVAKRLLQDIEAKATVDRYAADQLVIYCALANGTSTFRFSRLTEHLETNLWLIKSLLGADYKLKDNVLEIKGIGYDRTGFR